MKNKSEYLAGIRSVGLAGDHRLELAYLAPFVIFIPPTGSRPRWSRRELGDQQHRPLAMTRQFMADAAQEDFRNATESPAADDDQVTIDRLGRLADQRRRPTVLENHSVGQPGISKWLAPLLLELALHFCGPLRVVLNRRRHAIEVDRIGQEGNGVHGNDFRAERTREADRPQERAGRYPITQRSWAATKSPARVAYCAEPVRG
jgi:hypothetical protein